MTAEEFAARLRDQQPAVPDMPRFPAMVPRPVRWWEGDWLARVIAALKVRQPPTPGAAEPNDGTTPAAPAPRPTPTTPPTLTNWLLASRAKAQELVRK